ncbi:Clathrin heavy chain, partial [Coemansia sp. S610]
AMPYFINLMREYQNKVDVLTTEVGELKAKIERGANGVAAAPAGPNQLLGPAGLGGRLLIGQGPTPGNVFTPGSQQGTPGSGSQFGGY